MRAWLVLGLVVGNEALASSIDDVTGWKDQPWGSPPTGDALKQHETTRAQGLGLAMVTVPAPIENPPTGWCGLTLQNLVYVEEHLAAVHLWAPGKSPVEIAKCLPTVFGPETPVTVAGGMVALRTWQGQRVSASYDGSTLTVGLLEQQARAEYLIGKAQAWMTFPRMHLTAWNQ